MDSAPSQCSIRFYPRFHQLGPGKPPKAVLKLKSWIHWTSWTLYMLRSFSARSFFETLAIPGESTFFFQADFLACFWDFLGSQKNVRFSAGFDGSCLPWIPWGMGLLKDKTPVPTEMAQDTGMDNIQDELLASQQGVVQELARANGELRHGDLWVTGRWKVTGLGGSLEPNVCKVGVSEVSFSCMKTRMNE